MPDHQFSLFKPALIFIGSGLGGLLRYWLSSTVQNWWGPTFPLGTLIINISGCLAMGFLATTWAGPVHIREEYRVAVLVGVIGGYTTFSSFGRESLALIEAREWWLASWYVLGSNIFGLLAVWLGSVLATRIFGTGALCSTE